VNIIPELRSWSLEQLKIWSAGFLCGLSNCSCQM
jgi:hypothetical protein